MHPEIRRNEPEEMPTIPAPKRPSDDAPRVTDVMRAKDGQSDYLRAMVAVKKVFDAFESDMDDEWVKNGTAVLMVDELRALAAGEEYDRATLEALGLGSVTQLTPETVERLLNDMGI